MLIELAVRNLGVIAEARIPLSGGLTAVTGETGAGKTMVVEALGLLCGGRPEPTRVRPGATESVVEGLFVSDRSSRDDAERGYPDPGDPDLGAVDRAVSGEAEGERVLRRVVPAVGRSRSYVDENLSTAAGLAEVGGRLIELHGQHAQQALLRPAQQRDALDRFAGIDTEALKAARASVAALERRLEDLGGDDRSRAREIDLLRYQVDEIESVDPRPGEDEALSEEEDLLADAVAHREAASDVLERLGGDGGTLDALAEAVGSLRGHRPFEEEVERLDALTPELQDVISALRTAAESIEPDDERLAEVRDRRQRFAELRRKYGDDMDEVLLHAEQARRRLEELTSLDVTRALLGGEIDAARAAAREEGRRVGSARRAAAPLLAERLVVLLGDLALPGSRVEVEVSDRSAAPGEGDEVELLLSTNPGAPLGGLGKVASGGELSRVMLALRLVLTGGPDVMVFDEVDAGVGGEAATAVGAALARLAEDRQVLVVTHLPQVAAFADQHLKVVKRSDGTTTVTEVEELSDEARVIELSRMMTGQPDSSTARDHAQELLATSAERRQS